MSAEEVFELELDVTVKQHPYRTARVSDRFMVGPRYQMQPLEKELAEKSGARMDNHTVYEVTSPGGKVVFIWFHDSKVDFGNTIVKGR